MASSAQGKMAADVKNEIMERVRLFSGDCCTFWRVRLQQNKWFHHWKLGGGNFIMALAMFSALNFLAKVHLGVSRSNPSKGKTTDSDAFKWLIKALHEDGLDLGIPDNEAGAVWHNFRDKLTHVAKPGSFVGVYDRKKSFSPSAAEKMVRTEKPSFYKNNGRWMCNADRLSVDVIKVAEWVCEKVDVCPNQSSLQTLSDWLLET